MTRIGLWRAGLQLGGGQLARSAAHA